MKRPLALILALAPVAALALDAPPSFSEAKLDAPATSLLADAATKAPPFVSDFDKALRPPPEKVRMVSRMPVMVPAGDTDPRLVRAPDPSVDYALTVAVPEVAPAK